MGRRRKKTQFVVGSANEFDEAPALPGFENAYVQIGGLKITNHGLSTRAPNSRAVQRSRHSQFELDSEDSDEEGPGGEGSEDDGEDEAVQDYLANLMQQDDEEQDEEKGGEGECQVNNAQQVRPSAVALLLCFLCPPGPQHMLPQALMPAPLWRLSE